MKEQIIAKAYAKAFFQLGQTRQVNILEGLSRFYKAMNDCEDLKNVLYSGMVTIEEKIEVSEAVAKKIKVPSLVKECLFFLLGEKRMDIFPLIVEELTAFDNEKKGVVAGIVKVSDGKKMDEGMRKKLIGYLEKYLGKKVKLNYQMNDEITLGWKVMAEDLLLDISIDKQLNRFSQAISN